VSLRHYQEASSTDSDVYRKCSGVMRGRSSRLGNTSAIAVGTRLSGKPQESGAARRLGSSLGSGGRGGAGARSRAAELAVPRVVITAACGLDVSLRPLGVDAPVVVDEGIQAGQARAGGEEDGQEKEGPGLNPSNAEHGKSIHL
jgi:hypothetical protein